MYGTMRYMITASVSLFHYNLRIIFMFLDQPRIVVFFQDPLDLFMLRLISLISLAEADHGI